MAQMNECIFKDTEHKVYIGYWVSWLPEFDN